MARNFKELEEKMAPAARQQAHARAKKMIEEMALDELRAARQLTQTSMAKILEVGQSEISKIENRTDMYVSTLASYVEAMGGTLEIRAVFPEGAVKIAGFGKI
jgi:DNA-binding XRE family transcriptional regulator